MWYYLLLCVISYFSSYHNFFFIEHFWLMVPKLHSSLYLACSTGYCGPTTYLFNEKKKVWWKKWFFLLISDSFYRVSISQLHYSLFLNISLLIIIVILFSFFIFLIFQLHNFPNFFEWDFVQFEVCLLFIFFLSKFIKIHFHFF